MTITVFQSWAASILVRLSGNTLERVPPQAILLFPKTGDQKKTLTMSLFLSGALSLPILFNSYHISGLQLQQNGGTSFEKVNLYSKNTYNNYNDVCTSRLSFITRNEFRGPYKYDLGHAKHCGWTWALKIYPEEGLIKKSYISVTNKFLMVIAMHPVGHTRIKESRQKLWSMKYCDSSPMTHMF